MLNKIFCLIFILLLTMGCVFGQTVFQQMNTADPSNMQGWTSNPANPMYNEIMPSGDPPSASPPQTHRVRLGELPCGHTKEEHHKSINMLYAIIVMFSIVIFFAIFYRRIN